MSWGDRCVRDRRVEFVIRASRGGAISALCREYQISRPTGYLWLRRFQQEGVAGIEERSHRPHHSPCRTASVLEQRIAQLRAERPDWGAQAGRVAGQRRNLLAGRDDPPGAAPYGDDLPSGRPPPCHPTI